MEVQPQQVDQAVAGGLKHRHLAGEQGGGGEQDRPPGDPDLPHDRRASDQVGDQGDDAEAPQHHHQQEGAQAAGAPGCPRRRRGGGDVHAAPS
jgi:hypothetical protein